MPSLEDQLKAAIEGADATVPVEAAAQPAEPDPSPAATQEADVSPESPSDDMPDIVRQHQPSPPPAEEPVQGGTTDLLSRFREKYGVDLSNKYTDDEQLMRGLVNAYQTVGKRDEDALRWRSFSQDPEAFIRQWGYARAEELVRDHQTQQVPESDVPEYDPAWQSQIERDPETGAIVGVRPGSDPTILAKIRKAEDFFSKRQLELAFSPEKVLEPLLKQREEEIIQKVLSQVGGQLQVQQQAQQAESFIYAPENRKWIFNAGDPQRGLSEQGKRFAYWVNDAVQNEGINPHDMTRCVRHATRQMELDYYRSKNGQKPPAPAQTATATRQPNVAAAAATDPDAVDWNEGENLMDALFRTTGIKRDR